jgi:hypothetical protein
MSTEQRKKPHGLQMAANSVLLKLSAIKTVTPAFFGGVADRPSLPRHLAQSPYSRSQERARYLSTASLDKLVDIPPRPISARIP